MLIRPVWIVGLLAWIASTPVHADGPKPGEAAALRDAIRGQLTRELTEHWYPAAVDKQHGGFHQNMARDWSIQPDRDRFIVYQARLTWTAAAFALDNPDRRDEFNGYARWGVECLDKQIRDREQGGFHWSVGLDGQVKPDLGTEKHVYGTAFVLYAASKAYEATHDPRALQVARDAFDWLETKAHDATNGGYFEALTRDGTPIITWDPAQPLGKRVDRVGVYYGFKSMNAHIHLLEAVAEFYRVEPTAPVRVRLEELLAIVRDRITTPPGALKLYLTPTWQATPAHDSFGHDVETAYLLLEAAEVLGRPGDPSTGKMARSLIDHALDWGWDEVNGGFYDKGEVFNGKPFDTTKVWWTQAEGLNALLLFHSKFGGETDRYWQAFLKQWDFINKHLIDPEHGGWFYEATTDGGRIGDGAKASPWKANYHTSRALINVARLLDQIARESPKEPVKGP